MTDIVGYVVLLPPENLRIRCKVKGHEHLPVVVERVTGRVDLPSSGLASLYYRSHGIHSLLEIVIDFLISNFRIEELVTLCLMVLLPCSFKQGHLTLENAGYILVDPHCGIAGLHLEVLYRHIKVSKYLVSDESPAVTRHLELLDIRIEHLLHPCHTAIVLQEKEIIPGPEIIDLSYTLLVFRVISGACIVPEAVDHEVGSPYPVVCRQCSGTGKGHVTVETGINGSIYHIVTHDIAESNASSVDSGRMSAESILIEVVQILLHLAHGPEHSGSGYDTFRFLVQTEASRDGSNQCQSREKYI